MARLFGKKMLWTILIVLAVILIINITLLLLVNRNLNAAGGTATEAATPVALTIVDAPACTDCRNASLFQDELTQLGVDFSSVRTYSLGSSRASSLIKKYGLTKLPALIFSKGLGDYPKIVSAWDRVGTVASDGSYLLQGAVPPYYDLQTKSVKGLVQVTYLKASGCPSCYDVTLHRRILQQFGMVISDEQTVDVSSPEGAALVSQYNLTEVPTILIAGDASSYPNFVQAWQSVGTEEPDGAFIFRDLSVIGQPYLDLSTGQVVTPKAENAS